MDMALKLLLKDLDDGPIIGTLFEPFDPLYEKMFITTWSDLEDKLWIEERGSAGGHKRYALTGAGWIEGLERTGKINLIRERLPQLCKAAKGFVKGRDDDQIVFLSDLAAASGLTNALVENIIESYLLYYEFPDREYGLRWSRGNRPTLVRIPSKFGLERL